MLTLFDLWQLTARSGQPPTLRLLLLTWLRQGAPEEWSRLFLGLERTPATLEEFLEKGWSRFESQETELLDKILDSQEPGSLHALHLLQELLRMHAHPFTGFFSSKDLARLKSNLGRMQGEGPGLLAVHGIEQPRETSALDRYGRDLTAEAEKGAFEALAPRPEDLDRLTQVLMRAQKGNPVLTGPAGVGKTALVELLAAQLVKGEATESLLGSRVVEISMGKLVAGTRYRGDFEERFEQVMAAVQEHPNTIIFIDELHLIWGAGRAEGVVMDASNLLKPYLARGGFRLIGASTVTEYRRYIASDPALARRFQEIRLREPEPEVLFRMVAAQAKHLAKHHGITLDDAIITQAIELTDQHLLQRQQPDKSVDLLDCASVDAIRSGFHHLDAALLKQTLARMTDRPLLDPGSQERQQLVDLATSLRKRIFGQDEALERVCATLLHRRMDYGTRERCLGTFLFVGETGTGKTELARALATEYFGRSDALLHLDMAEYASADAINSLLGAPLGYADHGEPGRLVSWLQTVDSGLILLDEIEKAHPSVIRLLLGLLDNGRMTGTAGESLDARACIIVLTSNALLPSQTRKASIGFSGESSPVDVEKLLAGHFPVELLGRLDEMILFHPLDSEAMCDILGLQLDRTIQAFRRRQIHLVFDSQRLLDWLMERFKRAASGARGLNRLVETHVSQPISTAILGSEVEGPLKVVLGEEFFKGERPTVIPMDG